MNLLYECYCIILKCFYGISYVSFDEFVLYHPLGASPRYFICEAFHKCDLMRCLCNVSSIKILNLKTKTTEIAKSDQGNKTDADDAFRFFTLHAHFVRSAMYSH